MSELEYHQDKINEHDIWTAVRQGNVTPSEMEDFATDMQGMIDSIRSELSSLEDTLQDALDQINDAIPRCEVCDEPIDVDEREDGVCEDCEEPEEEETPPPPGDEHLAEQDILWM